MSKPKVNRAQQKDGKVGQDGHAAPANKSQSGMAQQIAQAAIAFEQRRTGNHVPKSVTVVLSEGTLVITLHEALSPAERALARSPAGAAQVQEFHRQLFTNASESLRQEIKRITGVEVREAAAEVEPATGTVVKVFTTGTVVQVFLLARSAPADTWSGDGEVIHPEKGGKVGPARAARPRPRPGGRDATPPE
jgi:uncharacterized protein YbcI